jgi:putative spermidine/putrescine transport system ATP-binding protein
VIPPFLSIQDLRKTFGAVVAVEDVTLDIPRGEFVTFLGPSGSGKSTTLYVLAGFQQPSRGDVLVEGRSILTTPSHRRDIGMVFQRYTLFPHLTVGDNVAFPLRVRRRPAAEIAARVRQMLSLVRLDGFADRMPGQLSGGQQQRVALARALAYDPSVLLMDEPLSALDKKLREEIQHEIRRIHHETGVTILYVTHDQEEALRLSDRIAVFNAGRIEQIGTGEELYNDPATRFVAGFVGNSNFLTARLERTEGRAAKAVFPDGTALAGARLHGSAQLGAEGLIMIRPENIRLGAAVATAETGEGLEVKIRDITFLGDSVHLLTETVWGQPVEVRAPAADGGARGLAIGDATRLQWDPARSHIFGNA